MAVLIALATLIAMLVIREIEEREEARCAPRVVSFEEWAAAYDAGSADENDLYTAYAMSTADRRGRA